PRATSAAAPGAAPLTTASSTRFWSVIACPDPPGGRNSSAEPGAAADTEPRLHGLVFLAVLHRRPDEHADHDDRCQGDRDDDQNDGGDIHASDDLPASARVQ